MIIESFDGGSKERRILGSMIADQAVLGRIAAKWTRDMFASKWANIVAEWCIKYYRDHGKAPIKNVLGLYECWAADQQDKDTVKLVERFLSAVSEDFERLQEDWNPDMIVSMAAQHFNRIKADRAADLIKSAIVAGRDDLIQKAFSDYSRVEMAEDTGIELFLDKEAVRSVFQIDQDESLVKYGGPIDHFLGDTFARGQFVSFLAPQKTGKSHVLMDLAYRLASQRKRTAFFTIGDMSRRQVNKLFLSRSGEFPFRAPGNVWPYTVQIPTGVKMSFDQKVPGNAEWISKTFVKAPLFKQAWAACELFIEEKVKSRGCYFKLETKANLSVNILQIKAEVEAWERSRNCLFDAIIIDYADNLQAVDARMDRRDSINMSWQYMRAIAHEKNCLVATATQTNTHGYGQFWLDRDCFSEDNRKMNQITSMIGLNQSISEKKAGIMRWNFVQRRDGAFTPYEGPTVATCFPLGNPCVVSAWGKEE